MTLYICPKAGECKLLLTGGGCGFARPHEYKDGQTLPFKTCPDPLTPIPAEGEVCPNCDGEGQTFIGDDHNITTCPVCHGSGKPAPSVSGTMEKPDVNVGEIERIDGMILKIINHLPNDMRSDIQVLIADRCSTSLAQERKRILDEIELTQKMKIGEVLFINVEQVKKLITGGK